VIFGLLLEQLARGFALRGRTCVIEAWLAAAMLSSACRANPCSSENACLQFGQVTGASGAINSGSALMPALSAT
jgi:hypothetical protein